MIILRVKEFCLKYSGHILFFVLLVATILLRIPNLGYSDYIGDEHKAFIEIEGNQSINAFFMTRRKGPMQFLVSEIPHVITGNFRNELAQRIPFTVFGILSILVFYKFVEKVTGNKWVGFVSALLLSMNGFIVGFSRIAQYQNLNLFFSFAALYFYADLLKPKRGLITSTLIGSAMFCLSLLSHWDAVFVIPPILYFLGKFLLNKDIKKKYKIKLVLLNFAVGCAILPFIAPYAYEQITNVENVRYFSRRIELGHVNFERYKLLFELYNPFLVLWFCVAAAVLGLIWFRVSWWVLVWFLANYAAFELFVRKPGTHIYNFLIPIILLSSFGIVNVIKKIPIKIKYVAVFVVFVFTSFFYYQSYMLFVDHSKEYPWEKEQLLRFLCKEKFTRSKKLTKCGKFINNFNTREYGVDDKVPLFGFPHNRNWNEINDYINGQNIANDENFGYMTNEWKTISEWYMDTVYKTDSNFYVVGIKRPLSFVEDWEMGQIKPKNAVHEIKDEEGTTVVRIYRVEERK